MSSEYQAARARLFGARKEVDALYLDDVSGDVWDEAVRRYETALSESRAAFEAADDASEARRDL